MSEDQNKTIIKNVEIVDKYTKQIMGMTNKERLENVEEILEHSLSTLKFWKCDIEWPTNLIYCNLEYAARIIKFMLQIINVS